MAHSASGGSTVCGGQAISFNEGPQDSHLFSEQGADQFSRKMTEKVKPAAMTLAVQTLTNLVDSGDTTEQIVKDRDFLSGLTLVLLTQALKGQSGDITDEHAIQAYYTQAFGPAYARMIRVNNGQCPLVEMSGAGYMVLRAFQKKEEHLHEQIGYHYTLDGLIDQSTTDMLCRFALPVEHGLFESTSNSLPLTSLYLSRFTATITTRPIATCMYSNQVNGSSPVPPVVASNNASTPLIRASLHMVTATVTGPQRAWFTQNNYDMAVFSYAFANVNPVTVTGASVVDRQPLSFTQPTTALHLSAPDAVVEQGASPNFFAASGPEGQEAVLAVQLLMDNNDVTGYLDGGFLRNLYSKHFLGHRVHGYAYPLPFAFSLSHDKFSTSINIGRAVSKLLVAEYSGNIDQSQRVVNPLVVQEFVMILAKYRGHLGRAFA